MLPGLLKKFEEDPQIGVVSWPHTFGHVYFFPRKITRLPFMTVIYVYIYLNAFNSNFPI